jgi:hypothetical protein
VNPSIQEEEAMARATHTERLEVRLLFPADTSLATALAVAGLRPSGRIGTAEVWVSTNPVATEGEERS